MLLAHTNRLAAIWQWLAGPIAMATVIVLARRAGFGRAPALFAALRFACLIEVALETVTTQNDLLTAGLVAATAAFLPAVGELPGIGLTLFTRRATPGVRAPRRGTAPLCGQRQSRAHRRAWAKR